MECTTTKYKCTKEPKLAKSARNSLSTDFGSKRVRGGTINTQKPTSAPKQNTQHRQWVRSRVKHRFLVRRGHCQTLKILVDLLEFREQGQAESQPTRDCGMGDSIVGRLVKTQNKTNETNESPPILDRVVDAAVLTWSSATMCPQTQKQNGLANGWERGPSKCTQ